MAEAQLIHRPGSVWGQVPVQPEGLVLGSVELLAWLLIGLSLTWVASLWLLWEKWRLLGRSRSTDSDDKETLRRIFDRRRTILAWVTYGAAPIMGICATIMARHRTLFGIDVALLATGIALLVVVTGMAAFLLSAAVRAELEGSSSNVYQ